MRIALAYISVILLWATTPLAIKWSAEGGRFCFWRGFPHADRLCLRVAHSIDQQAQTAIS